jgi:hypothetical protein
VKYGVVQSYFARLDIDDVALVRSEVWRLYVMLRSRVMQLDIVITPMQWGGRTREGGVMLLEKSQVVVKYGGFMSYFARSPSIFLAE